MDDNIPKHIRCVISLDNINSCQEYLRIMTDFLFELMLFHKGKEYYSMRVAESVIWIQMMFTNALAFSKLLEGLPYSKNRITLNPIIDHRMMFTLGRTMYENFIAFGLIYITPSTEDEKDLIYGLYRAAGYKEQLSILSDELKAKDPEAVKELSNLFEQANRDVRNTTFYQTANQSIQTTIDNALCSGKYRYIIDKDHIMKKVNYDEAMSLMGIHSDIFDGMYKYFSNLSHPSHWGQRQFEQSFERTQPEYIKLVCLATRYVITFLSFFIADFIKFLPDSRSVLENQSCDHQRLISLYDRMFRF